MAVEIGVIRGATEEEVKSNKFNIYIGVSLGNKWFTKENVREYILWSLKYTKEKVAILIADTLHAINYEVRNKEKPDKAVSRAVKEGRRYEKFIREIISEIPKEQQDKIKIVKWNYVKRDTFNQEFNSFFLRKFNHNPEFREEVVKLVRYFTKKEKVSFSEREIIRLCEYILAELPELLHGFSFKGVYYNCYIYPHDNPLTRMVERIQNKELFPDFYDEIDIKKNVFVELKVLQQN